ncbi:IclR family transcriptional regulator [Paenarthrobacter sp. DKR-5]|uniref:IclR family transcriptional regulator n=1 Tax=Paenarthrobacter sp. DKR-5 TaxID=2835535 RepID=UPI001BDDA62D|nr:IclR family transcriptional regulator [Paenarthrobacter sp. DKR-5]MBT1001536.1 IclR family transcriptional regulator [Paenarthrobacter sp. DKR-5]
MSVQTERQKVKSADRALAVVEFVAAKGSVSFTEILDGLALPRSSAHGLLSTLCTAGWLDHNAASKQYSLGLRAWQVGQMYTGHEDLANVAKPVMDRLSRSLGETVQLARLDGVENVYIAISHSGGMRLGSSVGMRLLAHATGIGKALLSTLEPGEAARRLNSVALPRLTDKTVTDVAKLSELVAAAKTRGYALDDEEYLDGCRCVAVPLTTEAGGGMATALSVTMPSARTGAGWPGNIVRPLAAAAQEIRAVLGVREPGIVLPSEVRS